MWRRRDRCEHNECLKLAKRARRRGDPVAASRWFKLADGYLRHDIRQDTWRQDGAMDDARRELTCARAEAEIEAIRSRRAADTRRANQREIYNNLIAGLDQAAREAGGHDHSR